MAIEGDWADFPNVCDLAPLQYLIYLGICNRNSYHQDDMLLLELMGFPEEQIPISEHHHFEKYPEIFMFNVR